MTSRTAPTAVDEPIAVGDIESKRREPEPVLGVPAVVASVIALTLAVLAISLLGIGGLVLIATLAIVVGCLRYSDIPGAVWPADRWSWPSLPAMVARLRSHRAVRLLAGHHPLAAVVLAAALALIVVGQVRMTQPTLGARTLGIYLAGLTLFLVLHWVVTPAEPWAEAAPNAARRSSAGSVSARRWLLVGAALCGWVVWSGVRQRQPDEGFADIVAVWLLSLGLAILAAASPVGRWRPRRNEALAWAARHRTDWAIAGAITVTALVARLFALERFPNIFDADEAAMAMSAVGILRGDPVNPFGTGWFDFPNLFFYLQAGSIWLFGDSVAGVRTLSGLFGASAVLFTWLLARRLFDRRTAIVAASLLAVFHFHLHLSRLALNNVADSFFLMTTLFFLDRGFGERRRLDCLLAGVTIGLSQYFYTSGRLTPVVTMVVALYVGVTMLLRARRTVLPWFPRLKQWAGLVGWTAVGAGLAYLPLFAYYVDHPQALPQRVGTVSIFTSGLLAEQQRSTGESAVVLVARSLWRAALLPFHLPPPGIYRGDPPFIGLPMAIPLGIGLALITVRAWQPRFFGLAVAYWGATIGIGLTITPDTNRFAIAAPIIAIACGLALDALARIATALLGVGRRLVDIGLAVTVALLISWNVSYFFFTEHKQLHLYGDVNTLVAYELARHLEVLEPGTTVYFSGPPRMWYDGFPNLAFIARDARGISVDRPWDEASLVPKLDGPTLFVFLPERLGELEHIRSWYPNGETQTFHLDSGEVLFTVYAVEP